MRVVCVHPARDPVVCGEGPVRIGSAPDDTVVPAATGAAPHHLTIEADRRGLVLTVRAGCQRVYVNARAVRERALLRYGDTVTLGSNKFMLTSDVAPGDQASGELSTGEARQAVLRIVAGATSGQAIPIGRELRLGAGSPYLGDLAYACRITQDEGGLLFESDSAVPRVNGWRCERARLASDDQIVLGEYRLVVEAPGLQYAAHLASLPAPPEPPPPSEPAPDDDGPHTEIWWLIGAAALLALVIALFLYFRW